MQFVSVNFSPFSLTHKIHNEWKNNNCKNLHVIERMILIYRRTLHQTGNRTVQQCLFIFSRPSRACIRIMCTLEVHLAAAFWLRTQTQCKTQCKEIKAHLQREMISCNIAARANSAKCMQLPVVYLPCRWCEREVHIAHTHLILYASRCEINSNRRCYYHGERERARGWNKRRAQSALSFPNGSFILSPLCGGDQSSFSHALAHFLLVREWLTGHSANEPQAHLRQPHPSFRKWTLWGTYIMMIMIHNVSLVSLSL